MLGFVRHAGDERVLVVANLSASPTETTLELGDANRLTMVVDLLDGAPAVVPTPGMPFTLTLAPYSARWLSLVPSLETTHS